MLVNVRLIGNGTADDLYRASLPTYATRRVDYDKREIIVDVPNDVLGLTDKDLKSEKTTRSTAGDVYTSLSAENLDKVKAHLEEAYPGVGHKLELVEG